MINGMSDLTIGFFSEELLHWRAQDKNTATLPHTKMYVSVFARLDSTEIEDSETFYHTTINVTKI